MTFLDSFILDFVIPLLSISGLGIGWILSHLAKEEVEAGRKYFTILYRIIFIILSVVISYFLYPSVVAMIFMALSLLLLIFNLRKSSTFQFYIHYLFFLLGYFLSGQQLLAAAVLFLYGLPVGTMISMEKALKNDSQHE